MKRPVGKVGKKKILMLILAVIVFVIALVLRLRQQDSIREEYEKYQDKPEAETVAIETELTETERMETENSEEMKTVCIENLNQFMTDEMGDRGSLMEEKLEAWSKEHEAEVSTASIFYSMVSKSDPQTTQYYLRLDDQKNSILLLSYHATDHTVSISSSSYTEDEIQQEEWSDNGPDQRDVTPEEEAEFLNNQEDTDDKATEEN